MPYEFIDNYGRVIKAPTKDERNEAYARATYAAELRKKRKIAEEESRNRANIELNEFGQTPEQAAKRDYYVNLVQGTMNDIVDNSKKAATDIIQQAQQNTEYERLKDVEKVNYLKTGASILGVLSGSAAIGTPMTSSLYGPIMNINAGVGLGNSIIDINDGDYGQLALNLAGMTAPFSRFRYSKPIPTATWGRIGKDYIIDFSKHLESAGLTGDIVGLIKQIIKNNETKSQLDKMKFGGNKQYRQINNQPTLLQGGVAIPIRPGVKLLKGRTHATGGIYDGRVEAENNEAVADTGNAVIYGSAHNILDLHNDGKITPAKKKMGGNISPAKLIVAGVNPEVVNNAQQAYKDRFKLNDDGTRKTGGKKKAAMGDKEEYGTPQRFVAASDNRPVEVVVTPQGSYTGYLTSENSPIYENNDARIAASEQGRMDKVNKQIADNERIKNEILGAGKLVAENLPVIGDAVTIKDAYDDYVKGNTLAAGIGLGSLLLPPGVRKVTKAIKHNKLYQAVRHILPDPKSIYRNIIDKNKLKNAVNEAKEFYKSDVINRVSPDEFIEILKDINFDDIKFGYTPNKAHTTLNGSIRVSPNLADDRLALSIVHELRHRFDPTIIKNSKYGKIHSDVPEFELNHEYLKKHPKVNYNGTGSIHAAAPYEKIANNTQTRFAFWKEYRKQNNTNPTTQELDEFIKNLSDKDFYHIFRSVNRDNDKVYHITDRRTLINNLNRLPLYLMGINTLSNTKNNTYMKFGGRLTIIPFTGKPVQTRTANTTVAKLGTKKARLGAVEPNITKEDIIIGNDGTLYYRDKRTGMIHKVGNTAFVNGKLTRIGDFNVNNIELNDRTEIDNGMTSIPAMNFNRDNIFSRIEFPVADLSKEGDIPWLNRIPGYTIDRPDALRKAQAALDNDDSRITFTPKQIRERAVKTKAEVAARNAARRGEGLGDIKQTPIELNIAYPSSTPAPASTTTTKATEAPAAKATTPKRSSTPAPASTTTTLDFGDTPTIDRTTPIETITPRLSKSGLTRTRISVPTEPESSIVTSDGFTLEKPTIKTNPVEKPNLTKIKVPTVPNTKTQKDYSDIIGAGANVLGNVGSWIVNNYAINKMREPSAPIFKQTAKLKTRMNINPQLDKIRENVGMMDRNIRQNTMSSAVALNRLNRIHNAGLMNVNELYGQKENQETELINKDKLNQQQVANTNVDIYNQYQDKITDFYNKKRELKSENANALIQGLNTTVQNALTRIDKRNQFNKSLELIRRTYPKAAPYLLNS